MHLITDSSELITKSTLINVSKCLCRKFKFYSLGPCTLEAGMHYLKLGLISRAFEKQHHQAISKDDINWTQFKILADSIVSSLNASYVLV